MAASATSTPTAECETATSSLAPPWPGTVLPSFHRSAPYPLRPSPPSLAKGAVLHAAAPLPGGARSRALAARTRCLKKQEANRAQAGSQERPLLAQTGHRLLRLLRLLRPGYTRCARCACCAAGLPTHPIGTPTYSRQWMCTTVGILFKWVYCILSGYIKWVN